MKRDTGSTLPLIIGLATLLFGLVFAVSDLQSLLLQQQRALSGARLAALLVAKDSAGSPPVIGLDYSTAARGELGEVASLKVLTTDGKTFIATVCLQWNSPFGLHPSALVCDTAKARVIA